MAHPYQHGWYQIAFERDLINEITPLSFADTPLIAVKANNQVRIFDANCPHRGAHLGYETCLDGNVIACPFHGYRIGLGQGGGETYSVKEFQSFVMGGMVFIRLSERESPDFPLAINDLVQDHTLVTAFELQVEVPIEMVIENGFDQGHFKGVHGLIEEPKLKVERGALGELTVSGVFKIPRSSWNSYSPDNAAVITEFFGRAFSPGTIIVRLRGEEPYNYHIISSAVPLKGCQSCIVRLSLALPNKVASDTAFISALIEASKIGLQKDLAVWNHLNLNFQNKYSDADAPVLSFHRFCDEFKALATN